MSEGSSPQDVAERVEVTVLLVEGEADGAMAMVKTPHDEQPFTVPAALIEAGTGYDLRQMPGKRVVALVDVHGDLMGFERS
jgi:hypothetical protein